MMTVSGTIDFIDEVHMADSTWLRPKSAFSTGALTLAPDVTCLQDLSDPCRQQ